MAHSKKKPPRSKEAVKQKLRERKKLSKKVLKEKRARLVIRNLPFKATEENLKEYFEKYGEIDRIDLLKKSDGKLTGCCFIQFKLVQKAAKAKHHTDKKEFMGREINVDFAKPKDKYKNEIKKEENENPLDIKEEPIDVDAVKVEEQEDKKEDVEDSHDEDSSKTDVESEPNSDNEEDDEEESAEDLDNISTVKRNPHISNDITEGKTIFVKNVPFQATNEDLKQCMLQYGRVYYALICVDKFTEHSKGTAFVKFVEKEDAEKALNAGTELQLLGNILDCHPALGRDDVHKKHQEKQESKKKPNDSRNLYLVKEGVVLAGTKAAEGVSATDMSKRLQIEQYKTQMLRNLNMFVAKDRLVVHNLPITWDDSKLRTLFLKYGGPGAAIKEARVMRDMKNLDSKGVGKSKEYGFVAFTKHENASAALRNLNNNPNIFSSHKRPIITFSIENKSLISARLKRLEKSKLNNPRNKIVSSVKDRTRREGKRTDRKEKHDEQEEHTQKFLGVTSKPGTKHKDRSRYKLRTQAKLHFENLKKEKRKLKNAKKTLSEKKQDFIKQPKQKLVKKRKETDNFSKLVSDYKKKLTNASTVQKTKWYE